MQSLMIHAATSSKNSPTPELIAPIMSPVFIFVQPWSVRKSGIAHRSGLDAVGVEAISLFFH
jgi:hypothetical protein